MMRILFVYCKECNTHIAGPLKEVPNPNFRLKQGQDALRMGLCSVLSGSSKAELMISLREGEFCNHPDENKFQGCCGSAGIDGLNKLCSNGHEVATEFSDCRIPHYIAFDADKVIIKEKVDDYDYETIMI